MTSLAQPLPQSDHAVAPVRGQRTEPLPSSTSSGAPQDSRALQIRDWLLLLLRFAVTLDVKDETTASAKADQLDGLVSDGGPSAPTFFRRTTSEICRAIAALDDPTQVTVLKKHIARIDDPRLRRAFQAAVGIDDATSSRSDPKKNNLWAGLGNMAVAAHQSLRNHAAISKT
jgi:hypothetical protein